MACSHVIGAIACGASKARDTVASWSNLDNVYQYNITAASAAIKEVLTQPHHNTWILPSPATSDSALHQSLSPATFASPTSRISTPPNFINILLDTAHHLK